MTGLLAPNGKPSNLTPEQYLLVRSSEFKAWFGDWEKLVLTKINDSGIDEISLKRLEDGVSKVVDENGEPLVCYHGTRFGFFTEFDVKKIGRNYGDIPKGFYFTNFEEPNLEKGIYSGYTAKEYAEAFKDWAIDVDSHIFQVFLNIKNPYFVDNYGERPAQSIDFDIDEIIAFIRKENFQAIKNSLPKIDGIISKSRFQPVQEIISVAFKSNQIKLADGTNTTFDAGNPDIRFDEGGQVLYHGSEKPLKLNENIKPIFFTKDIDYSKGYGSNSYKYKVSVNNYFDTRYDKNAVFIYNEKFLPYALEKSREKFRYQKLELGQPVTFVTADLLWLFLRVSKRIDNDFGYDGIVVYEGDFSDDFQDANYSFVPLDVSQIKIIDSKNTDIRFDDGGVTDSYKIEFIDDRVLINGNDFGLLEFTIKENELEIRRLYLNKENQRIGIGRKIIGELFNQNPDVNKIIVYPLGSSIPFWLRFTEKVREDDYFEITKDSLKKGNENYPLKNNNRNDKFNDGGETQINEEAQQYIDIISMNPKLDKYQKYKVILKDKFGIDFDSIYKDQEYIDNANLNDIKKQDDFLDFDNWLNYAKIISKKRGFIPMDSYSTPSNRYNLTDEIWNETSKNLDFIIQKIPYTERGTGSGDIARALGDTIYYTDHADFYYFLHELGHIYNFQNNIEGIINNPAYSPTNYGTTNGGETFAENFAIYFINPTALKKWNEDVYNAIDSEINDKYKKEINRIMSNKKNVNFDGRVLNSVQKYLDYDIEIKNEYEYILTALKDGKMVGLMTFLRNPYISKDNGDLYLMIDRININEKEKGRGLATKMYEYALQFLPIQYEGIVSDLNNRVNQNEIPKIYSKFNNTIENWGVGNGYHLIKRNSFKKGGDVIINPAEIECHKCHWHWKVKDGGNDLFICHKCHYDNSKFYKFEGLEGEKILDTISYAKGGRTIAQTPAPKKDQIKGSDKNKEGSSKDLKSAKKIELSDKTIESIKNKVDKHNEKHPNKKITIESAKAVVRRGMGAYSSSHRPTIKGGNPNSRVAWGLARLNAFLYKIVNGKSKSGKYSQDNDLIEELGYKVAKYEIGGIFQGTPHNFNAYSTEYIGTGEGNQVFGWGLYFTDQKDIARYYMSAGLYEDEEKILLDGKALSEYDVEQEVKDQLVGIVNTIFGEDKLIPNIPLIQGYLILEYDEENYPEFKELVEESTKTWNFIKDKKLTFRGNIYYVTLFKGKNPNEYDLLKWEEKPTENQILKIKNQSEKEGVDLSKLPFPLERYRDSNAIYTDLSRIISGVSHLDSMDSGKMCSNFLLRAGIDGIKYKAGTLSGFEGQEGYNYVIFDANDITIEDVEKYDEILAGKEKYDDGGLIVGENDDNNKFPTKEEAFEIIEESVLNTGTNFIDEDGDGMFESKEQAQRFVDETYDFFFSIYSMEMIPVYRGIKADEVDLDPYGIGESWSVYLDNAKQFASHLGSSKELKIISAYVPKNNVDWENAFRLYLQFSAYGDSDAEFELPIPSNNKLLDVKVSDYKNAKELEPYTFENGGEADEPKHFWGSEAGGVLVYCSTTDRYLILLRSEWVLEPNTWGIISGKLDDDETNIKDAVLRESEEEIGRKLSDLIPTFIFEKPNFKFHNFVTIVDEEFTPELNWENSDYRWVKINEMPENLHFGLKLLLEKEDIPKLVEKNNTMNKNNPKDTITMDIPLLIRFAELMREDIKTDVALHEVIENLLEIKDKGVLTMRDYDSVVGNVVISEEKMENGAVVIDSSIASNTISNPVVGMALMLKEADNYDSVYYVYQVGDDAVRIGVNEGNTTGISISDLKRKFRPATQQEVDMSKTMNQSIFDVLMAEGGKVSSIKSKKGDIKVSLDENWYLDDTKVELVPVSELIKFREFDRKVKPKYNHDNSRDNINHLKYMFQRDGVKEPIIIEYSPQDNAVLVIEGNHRLNSAIDLGMEYLPARVVLRKYSKFSPIQLKNTISVSGITADDSGYISSDLKPSQVGITGAMPIAYAEGGIIEGRLHSECGDDGCGRKFQVGENGHIIEAERDEAVIVADAFDDNQEYTINGTPSQVASALNVMGGGKNFDKGATIIKNGQELEIPQLKKQEKDTDVDDVIDSGSIIINRRSMADEKSYKVTGSPKQIASAINSLNGNGVVIENGAEIKEN